MKPMIQILLSSLVLGLTGCLSSTSTEAPSLKQGESYSSFDVNRFAVNKLVCDPFDDNAPQDLVQGLHAKLWYLTANQPRYQSTLDMITHGQNSSQDLFFSEINVPTRLFNLGFPKESGGMVKDDQGQDLIEYFAMELNGGLRLGPEDLEGEYELAILSDDGATWSMAQGDGPYDVVVNNDGNHPTRLGCGQKVNFTNQSQFKVKFAYYQGPKMHISMIPIWRRVTASTTPEPLCGQLGNGLYFDYNNNSTPQQAYKDLLARGWRPLTKDNYVIPREIGYNPCVEGTPPIISNFQVTVSAGGHAKFTWTTNIPATSQVKYYTRGSTTETLTPSDNILRTDHEVNVSGLTIEAEYIAQSISISSDYGKGFSDLISFIAF